jgi:hypothetical protein
LDLWRIAGITPDLGVWLPLLSVGDPRCRSFAAPVRPRRGHAAGMVGEHDVARSLPAMVASSGEG